VTEESTLTPAQKLDLFYHQPEEWAWLPSQDELMAKLCYRLWTAEDCLNMFDMFPSEINIPPIVIAGVHYYPYELVADQHRSEGRPIPE
jgi:hypothetical protein